MSAADINITNQDASAMPGPLDALSALSPAYRSAISQISSASLQNASALDALNQTLQQTNQATAGGWASYAPFVLPALAVRHKLFIEGWSPSNG